MAATGILALDFGELVPARVELWNVLKGLDTALPVWGGPTGNEQDGGLPGLLLAKELLTYRQQAEHWKRQAHAALPVLRSRNTTVDLVADSPSFRGMTRKLALQAKRRGGRYADGRALLWLMDSTLHGLVAHTAYKVHGAAPREPTADDWDRARQALKVLGEARGLGIDISPSWPSLPWLVVPADWPERLATQLKKRQSLSRPYMDANFPERKACEMFVSMMFANFGGEVSPVLVQEFGDMIGWVSGRLPERVRRWVAELKSH